MVRLGVQLPLHSGLVSNQKRSGSSAGRNAASATLGNMSKYLLIKAVCDLMYFADSIYRNKSEYGYLFWGMFYIIYVNGFGSYFVLFLSSVMELLATLGK
jgi:hypothetical protein